MEPMEELKYEKPKNSQYQEMVKKFPVERLICWNGNSFQERVNLKKLFILKKMKTNYFLKLKFSNIAFHAKIIVSNKKY